jgi:hypothetical protein
MQRSPFITTLEVHILLMRNDKVLCEIVEAMKRRIVQRRQFRWWWTFVDILHRLFPYPNPCPEVCLLWVEKTFYGILNLRYHVPEVDTIDPVLSSVEDPGVILQAASCPLFV